MKILVFIVFTFSILSCHQEFKITPMYKDFNDEAEFNIQYFELTGYEKMLDSVLLENIIRFSEIELSSKNLMPPKVRIQNFYKKSLYNSCKDYTVLRYSARENDTGLLENCQDKLVSYIWYYEINKKPHILGRNISIFTSYRENKFLADKKKVISRVDTLEVVQNKWILKRKGKIIL